MYLHKQNKTENVWMILLKRANYMITECHVRSSVNYRVLQAACSVLRSGGIHLFPNKRGDKFDFMQTMCCDLRSVYCLNTALSYRIFVCAKENFCMFVSI